MWCVVLVRRFPPASAWGQAENQGGEECYVPAVCVSPRQCVSCWVLCTFVGLVGLSS